MFQKSAIRGTLLGLDYMGKEGRGHRKGGGLIINHADTAALDALPYTPAYVASKAGIIYSTLSFGVSISFESLLPFKYELHIGVPIPPPPPNKAIAHLPKSRASFL